MDLIWAAEAGARSEGSGYWQLAMVLLGIGLLGVFARWRKSRPGAPAPTAREWRERDRDPNRYRDAADRAIVEILETSRSLNAQVDTKIRVLNRLVKEAEEKTAALENLLQRAGAVLDGAESASSARAAASGSAAGNSRRSGRMQPNGFVSELQQRIFMLREEGKSLAEIAKATSLSTTEVKFALDSRDRAGSGMAARDGSESQETAPHD